MFKYLLSTVGKVIYLKFFIPQNIGEKDFGIFPNLAENYGAVKPASLNPKTSGVHFSPNAAMGCK